VRAAEKILWLGQWIKIFVLMYTGQRNKQNGAAVMCFWSECYATHKTFSAANYYAN